MHIEEASHEYAGTIVDKSVDRLLKGKTYNFIKCKHVDYSSTKSEEFLDLQLDVMGCASVYDSLDKICKVEELSGDNKYDAEGHGLQDATKGILFEELPPVLQLHLRRFDFDLQTWTSIKVRLARAMPGQHI
jgi:ubiquitin carboxyl-terminal hydrolase 7